MAAATARVTSRDRPHDTARRPRNAPQAGENAPHDDLLLQRHGGRRLYCSQYGYQRLYLAYEDPRDGERRRRAQQGVCKANERVEERPEPAAPDSQSLPKQELDAGDGEIRQLSVLPSREYSRDPQRIDRDVAVD